MTATLIDPALIASLTRACEDRAGRPISGGREIRFRCPAHQPDAHPSARWNPEKAVWRCDACEAGGGAIELADLLGIDRDRWPDRPPERPYPRPEPVRRPPVVDQPLPAKPAPGPERIVAAYAYGDDRRIVRLEPKSFRPQYRVGDRWRNGRPHPESWPLYRQDQLPDDLTADVHVTEGERDADTLAGLGWVAVSPGSSSNPWQAAWTAALAGRPVVIHADNDGPGRKRGDEIARLLTGRAASVRMATYADLPPGSDVSDFLSANDAGALAARIEALEPFIAAPEPTPERPMLTRIAVVQTMSDVEARPVDWLWKAWIPRGKVSILGGHPGDGKSTIALALASTLSRGGILPDGQRAPLTSTLLLLAEDDLADTVRPRIDVHGGDARRIHAIEVVREPDGRERFVSLADHVPELREQIIRHDIGFLVIDPLTAFLPKADRNAEGDVRDALMPLLRLAGETGVAVLGIMHIGKATGTGRKPLQTLLGSTAFGAIARSVLMTADLPEDKQPPKGDDGQRDTLKLLGVVKSNVAQRPAAWTWCRPMDGPIRWLGRSELSVEDVIAGEPPVKPIEQATEFLRDYLADQARFARDVERVASERGIAKRTLERARNELGIRPFKASGVRNGSFIWPSLSGATEPGTDVRHLSGGHNVADIDLAAPTDDRHTRNMAVFPAESEDRHTDTGGGHRLQSGPTTDVRHNPYIGEVADIDPSEPEVTLSPEWNAQARCLTDDLREGGAGEIARFRTDLNQPGVRDEDRAPGMLAVRLAGQP